LAAPSLAAVAAAPAAIRSSGSLFNKNFILGAVTGLLVGAFLLPVLIEMVTGGGNDPIQAQAQSPAQAKASVLEQQIDAQSLPGFNADVPVPEKGKAFLDQTLESNQP